MALISKDARIRLVIPHEPGEWVEIRPLTVRVVLDVSAAVDKGANFGVELVRRSVLAWSYDEPVSDDAIDRMDSKTFAWLTGAISPASGERNDAEKKDSETSSTDGPSPTPTSTEPAPSQTSSGT